MNVVTWQWAGYYMIIIYAALQGIDSSHLRGGPDGRRQRLADRASGSRSRWSRSALLLILVFALIGTLQFFTEPQVLRPVSQRHHHAGLHPEHLRVQPGLLVRQLQLRLGDQLRARHRGLHRASTSSSSSLASAGASSHDHRHQLGAPAADPSRSTGDRRPRPGTAATSCRTCSWASSSIYFLVPIWWLFVASTKNAPRPVQRHRRRPLVRPDRSPSSRT